VHLNDSGFLPQDERVRRFVRKANSASYSSGSLGGIMVIVLVWRSRSRRLSP
jgi:hypothetical protein